MPEIPEYLKQFRNFIVYRTEPNPHTGKLNKIPTVSVTDRSKWVSYDEACNRAGHQGTLGVGFALSPESRIAVVDVDGCRDPQTGTLTPFAQVLLNMLAGAYVEVSISGKGIHIWFSYTGEMPAHGCRSDAGEFYHRDRFFALGSPYSVAGFSNGKVEADLTDKLSSLSVFFPTDAPVATDQAWEDGPCEEWNGPADDGELVSRAMRSGGAPAAFGGRASFADLWLANESALSVAYPDANGRPYDASAADAALAQHLSFWTGKNCERIQRIMRQSALYRDKWEREDYLPRTILSAVARQRDVYQERRPAPTAPSYTVPSGTPDELTPDDFYAYLPDHKYINRRTREFFSADAVNGHLRRFSESLGMKPAAWLDMFRAVQQMSWQPSYSEIIEGMRSDKGHLVPEPKGRIYNLYRPSDAIGSDVDPSPWVNHVHRLFPGDADHIEKWFAYRIQNPGEKINHALVIGGSQGIGKDLMLEPLRYGVGRSNLADVNPGDLFKDFNGWVESTLLIVNEARDLGEVDRYKFYESSKRFIAAPPDTLPCNRKYLAAYEVPNVMAVIITTNNKLSGLYIEPDDRRHYVAWSTAERQPSAYFDALWEWMQAGGKQAVVGYLQRLDIAQFNPNADPPKTEAWRQIVAANSNPEENDLFDALEDGQGVCVQIATVREIIAAAQFRGHPDLAAKLMDRKNARKIPHLLERIGLEALPNPYAKGDGRWRLQDGRKDTLYVDRTLPYAERLRLATAKAQTGKSSAPVIQ